MAPDNTIQTVNWKTAKTVADLDESKPSTVLSEPIASRNGADPVYGDEKLPAEEAPRPRQITAPSFLDNVFKPPTGESSRQTPRLALHECEDTQPVDIDGRPRSRYGSQSASNNAIPLLTPSESGWSEWSFASIATINDRGNEAHWEWEQSLSRNRAVEEKSRQLGAPVSSMNPGDSVTGMTTTNQNVKILQKTAKDRRCLNDAINTESICNRLCGAFVESAFDDKSYLPLDQLCDTLDSDVVRKVLLEYFDENRTSHLERAVLGVRPSRLEKQPTPPLRRKILAILILINQVQKLDGFVEQNITDKNLPFTFNSNQSEQGTTVYYSTHNRDSPLEFFEIWPHKLARDFALYQQIIHVPFFRFPGDEVAFYHLDHGSTLPFCHYEAPKSGGYGSVRRAGVHHAHHNLGDKHHPPKPKNFAVKRLHVPDGDDFLREVALFDKLGVQKRDSLPSHLLPLQLTYRHGRDFFLMFPWADGNLKEFWKQNQANPRDHDQIRWLLEQCYGIARGLRRIHHLTSRSKEPFDATNAASIVLGPEPGSKEWGRHGDIKPENILWFKKYEGHQDHLVISDFGLTRFHSAHSRSKVLQDQIQGYSGTYQAPDLRLDAPINSRYDVWSLGCVLLEFVSWFFLGFEQGVEKFLRQRLNDKSEGPVLKLDKFFSIPEDNGNLQREKSAKVKESVVLWIEKLHRIKSVEPLHALLDLIESTMLRPNSQDRWDCDYIREEFRVLYNATTSLGRGDKGVRRDRNPALYAYQPRETSGDYCLSNLTTSGTKKQHRHNSSFSKQQRPFMETRNRSQAEPQSLGDLEARIRRRNEAKNLQSYKWNEDLKRDEDKSRLKGIDAKLLGSLAETTSADNSAARPNNERGNTQQQVNRLGAQFDGVYETAD